MMGMYDTIKFVIGKTDAPTCADGHFVEEFQTKDLACDLDTYYVLRDRFYRRSGRNRQADDYSEHIEHHENRIEIVKRSIASVFVPGLRELTAYGYCDECLPVLVENDNLLSGALHEERPWVQYTLRLDDDGRIVEMILDRERSTSREQLRAQFPRAVPDDDRVARRHFELLLQQRKAEK